MTRAQYTLHNAFIAWMPCADGTRTPWCRPKSWVVRTGVHTPADRLTLITFGVPIHGMRSILSCRACMLFATLCNCKKHLVK